MITLTFEINDTEFDVEFEYTPAKPAKITMDPFWSEPPESADYEILEILQDNKPVTDLDTSTLVEEWIDENEEDVMKQLADRAYEMSQENPWDYDTLTEKFM